MTASLHADDSRVGASFIAKRTMTNPREVITRLVEQHPSSSKDELFALFREELEADDTARRAVEWYFFVNMYEYLKTSRNRKDSAATTRQMQEQRVSEYKDKLNKLILMNLMLPNGKLLRNATFGECAQAGGWLSAVAKKGKPRQIVGRVLTEAQLRALRDGGK